LPGNSPPKRAICWNADEVAQGLAAVEQGRDQCLLWYRDLVDSFHHTERSLEFHELVGGDWLQQFSHVVYAAWRSASVGGIGSGDLMIPAVADSKAFSSLVSTPAFHDHLESIAAAMMGVSAFPATGTVERGVVVNLGARTGWRGRLVGGALRRRTPQVMFCHPYYKCSHREWFGALLRWRGWAGQDDLDYPVRAAAQLDASWRRARAATAGHVHDFPSLLHAMLPLYIPVSLLEAFPSLQRTMLALALPRPRLLYTASALHGHLGFKILAAAWREQGTQLASHQHGNGYGFDLIHAIEDYELRAADRFYSWGWRRHDRPVIPLSPPSLPSYPRRPRRVLLNCVEYPVTVYRLHFQPMPGTMETLLTETAAFLVALRPSADIMVRPYHVDFGWHMKATLRRAAPWATFDEERPSSFVRYAESRLVVHNYLGTGWLETLALDVPTICFYDPQAYRFRSDVAPHIEAFERVGILHRSAVGAARFITGLWQDPEGWWRSAEVQEARESFVRTYARFSPDWRAEWEREFEDILR
jgi:putative transferase (TIGR04331 family)